MSAEPLSSFRYHPTVDMLRGEQDENGLSARELEEYLAGLDKDGGSTAYLFRFLHCGTHLAYSDFE